MLCSGCDVGLVDVVIFDCYCIMQLIVYNSSMFFFVYFNYIV